MSMLKPGSAELIDELFYRRYLMDEGRLPQFFEDITLSEYMALHAVSEAAPADEEQAGRLYLQELSEKMHLPIRPASQIVSSLRDRGLLAWAHDGDGAEGTYVTLTAAGEELLQRLEGLLRDCSRRVADRFGRDRLIQLLSELRELDRITDSTLREIQGKEASDGDQNGIL